MKIYTKTGDKGATSLVGGKRVKKYDPLLNAYGTVDELNAFVGLAIAANDDALQKNNNDDAYVIKQFQASNKALLTQIQENLFVIGGMLATSPEEWTKFWANHSQLTQIIEQIEKNIDELQEKVGPFQGFVLPQGSEIIARLHLCRTVCRRTERLVAEIADINEAYQPILTYLNRLSDFFFVLALFQHKISGKEIAYWKAEQ